jgi:LysR family transcriptional activator of nhaA
MTNQVRFNPNQLLTFLAVVNEGSESKAAKSLAIGQPAISLQLKSLEAALGYPLFNRHGRRMTLTSAGDIARRYASRLWDLCGGLVQDLSNDTATRHQTIRLGILDGVPKDLVVKLSAQLLLQSPELKLQLSEGKGSYLMTELAHHQLDGVLLNYSPESTTLLNLRAKRLGVLDVGVFGSLNPSSAKPKTAKELLQNHPLILPTYASRLRGECDRYFIESGITPKARVEVEDTALQRLLALKGFGLALLPIGNEADQEREQDPMSGLGPKSLRLLAKLHGVREDIWLVTHAPGKGNDAPSSLWQVSEKLLRQEVD